MTQLSRRSLFSLFVLPHPKIVHAATRPPDAMILVYDDAKNKAEMAEVNVWLDKGYTIEEVVRQMAVDFRIRQRA